MITFSKYQGALSGCFLLKKIRSLRPFSFLEILRGLQFENPVQHPCYSWLCPTIGMTFIDIFTDSLLAIEYYYQYNNR